MTSLRSCHQGSAQISSRRTVTILLGLSLWCFRSGMSADLIDLLIPTTQGVSLDWCLHFLFWGTWGLWRCLKSGGSRGSLRKWRPLLATPSSKELCFIFFRLLGFQGLCNMEKKKKYSCYLFKSPALRRAWTKSSKTYLLVYISFPELEQVV